MGQRMKSKALALLMVVVMAVGIFSVTAFAVGDAETPEVKYSLDKGQTWTEATLIDAIWAGYSSQEIYIELQRDITLVPAYGIVMANENCSLTLDGKGYTITRGEANKQLFSVNSRGSTVKLTNITIDGGAKWSGDDPAARTNSGIVNSGTYQMFAVSGGATLTLDNGTVLQNNDLGNNAYGGAVYVGSGGSLIMKSGASIKNNAAQTGGGVCVLAGGTFTVEDGTISGNYAYSGGGAVYTSGDMEMRSGSIENNASGNNGGGVCVSSNNAENAAFTMADGQITGNKSVSGGGVSILNGETFNISGGSVTGNSITGTMGGGVLVYNGFMAVSGAPKVSGNTDQTGAANNTYLPSDSIISISDALTEGASIGVTTQIVPTESNPVTITGVCNNNYSKYFSDDKNLYYVTKNENNEVQFTVQSSGSSNGTVIIYQITAPTNVENGSMSISDQSAFVGDTIVITVEPDEGYELENLVVTDESGRQIELSNKGDGKYAFTMPFSNVTISIDLKKTGESEPTDLPFTDVTEDDWFYSDVEYACGSGLMQGTSTDEFSPYLDTTRGMIVTILYRMENGPTVSGDCPFEDIDTDSYYKDAVTWAAANGIVKGYSETAYGPDDNITREQMAAILYRYAEYKGYDISGNADLSKFIDKSEISEYAVMALTWANAEGLVNGRGNGLLDPKGNSQRCEVAAILHRFYNKFIK